MESNQPRSVVALAVIAAALGFFVDAYDLLLYSIVRNQSLAGIGLTDSMILDVGIDLLNAQLVGMLAGGVAWGVLGDIYGRRSVLFGSITLYSIATFVNGYAQDVTIYAACRFTAGFGLAGELGAGVTLVSELMSKENRGYGTMIVAAVGVLGVVTASLIGDIFPWRTAYFIGGVLGFMLLLLRLGVRESTLFNSVKNRPVSRGNFPALFTSAARLKKYACLILVAMPIWYVIGILITFSPEIGGYLGLNNPPKAGTAIMLYYLALTLGDLTNGFLSQRYKSRKKIIAVFMALTVLFCACYFTIGGKGLIVFYSICFLVGWSSGYWAVFVTVSAEQFGTNLRATVAVTAPNFVRGLTTILTIAFKTLKSHMGAVPGAIVIGAVTILFAFLSLKLLEETYGKDLDYIEDI
ncbi:Major facilitator transporter [uncultured Desulfobacterium sp.]|uniref:Major facilitator transporter n=1 Tax=uncultured Desulfobacterium sp. TaxID=201089 RepID=A0A445N229_9BACT|nr:Major facilitator transporter [uncultured Desulfobacterium sp.]